MCFINNVSFISTMCFINYVLFISTMCVVHHASTICHHDFERPNLIPNDCIWGVHILLLVPTEEHASHISILPYPSINGNLQLGIACTGSTQESMVGKALSTRQE
ncbi:hypothetical protein CDAR_235911 [Caerostris darwini]|uniref:Uncharacterized protein n=1 Tax=Caerostris darwini TaxID=1538125 RepID=A0AAV4RA97_9ARAC|nr:hypothetical protein CDAR_235911 [Caerostris darwini]